MIKNSFNTFVRSKFFVGIVAGVGIMLFTMVVFEIGVFVGFHQAQFSARWGENYQRNFGGPGMGIGFDDQLPNAHGAFGQVVGISSSTLTITNEHQQEQKVLLGNGTIIRNREATLSPSQLSTGEYVIVLGDPNETGEVDAKFIRIMPAPGTTTMPGMPGVPTQ